MNLKDWYSQKQAMSVLGMDYKMQIHRVRKNFIIKRICNKPFYLRQSIHEYMEDLIYRANDPDLRWDYEARKLKAVRYDVSFTEWLPRCLALDHFPYNAKTLYSSSEGRLALIRTREYYGQMFFSVEDMIRYIKISQDITDEEKEQAIEGFRNINV